MDGDLSLLTLPREVRDNILEQAIISDGPLFLVSQVGTTPVLVSATQVMRTCKQIHDETRDAIQRLQKRAAETGISRPVPILHNPARAEVPLPETHLGRLNNRSAFLGGSFGAR